MEITIGIRNVAREVILSSNQDAQEIRDLVTAALNDPDTQVLTLTDEHGKTTMVPTGAIGFIEIGSPEVRKVGFGQ